MTSTTKLEKCVSLAKIEGEHWTKIKTSWDLKNQKQIRTPIEVTTKTEQFVHWVCNKKQVVSEQEPSDYFSDLASVQRLRARLTKRQREAFAHYLAYREVLRDEDYIGYIELPALDTFNLIDASAETQAEALGIILGLWK